MNDDLARLRQILPFAAALYLAAGFAQQPRTLPRGCAKLSDLTWHMLQVADNERGGVVALFPAN